MALFNVLIWALKMGVRENFFEMVCFLTADPFNFHSKYL